MSLVSCPTGLQDPSWCPKTLDDALPAVLGLLPPGEAWNGAAVSGTVQNQYWRSYATLLSFTYGRLCDFVDEFFCATRNESNDQWLAEYGLPNDCDPYGNNLCLKVAAQGGATCEYFVTTAHQTGWVVTCEDNFPEAIAGCFEIGCTSLGPTPVYSPVGTGLGIGSDSCNFGPVTDHPDKSVWKVDAVRDGFCPVPGSNLGHGPDTDESCCFIVGYYDYPVEIPVVRADYCSPGNTLEFECPREHVPLLYVPTPTSTTLGVRDSTNNYTEWGHSDVWTVTVDIAASRLLQGITTPPVEETISAAGNFMAGYALGEDGLPVGGNPLCAESPAFILCFLELIKPAHTTLNLKVIQP